MSSLTLRVPPLRDRRQDVKALAEAFLTAYTQKFHKRLQRISEEALQVLQRWRWPGNVRELKAVIQRAVLMNDGDELLLSMLPLELVTAALDPVPGAIAEGPARIATLDEIELRYMRAVLALTGGNKLRAAEHLGITRQTLAKRLGDTD